jgi:hypothetical protein
MRGPPVSHRFLCRARLSARLKGTVRTTRWHLDSRPDRTSTLSEPRRCLASHALVPTVPSSVSGADRCCPSVPPSLSGCLRRRELFHGERNPSPLLPLFRPWNVEPSSLSLHPDAGPPPATGALASSENAAADPVFSPSPSTRSSGELSPSPPCPVASLSAVGARATSFAPPPP